jgi:hypothetical protein
MNKEETLKRANNSVRKIKNLLYGRHSDLIGLPEVWITDSDYDKDEGLVMILLEVSFKIYSEPILEEMVAIIDKIDKQLIETMSMVSFDSSGDLFGGKVGSGLKNINSPLVAKLNFSYRDDSIEFVLGFMFS